jgi:hypothetical protein
MSTSDSWESGGCLCGAVGYAIDRSGVVGQAHCHCRDCQRATGSAFATFCFVPDASFRSESGEAAGFTRKGESGRGVTRFFCRECGSQLYSEIEMMPGVRFVKSGSLDDASWLEPSAAFWCGSAQPWAPIPEGITRHEANPG